MLDVLTIGDLMIDFTALGTSQGGRLIFERNPGGAPANVASQVARLGGRSGFIGTVGNDEHGTYLIDTIKSLGIDSSCVRVSPKTATRITFVYLKQDNDRYFSTYQSPRADQDLPESPRYYEKVNEAKVFHLASTALFEEPIASTTAKLLDFARARGKLVSYDPNWNEISLGFDPVQKKIMTDMFDRVDILKISKEEYDYFVGDPDLSRGAKTLTDRGVRLLAVTMGAGGCYYRTQEAEGFEPAFPVEVRDTTGSGDSFMGGLLYQIARLDKEIEALTPDELSAMIRFSNACGSSCATKSGSLLVMPDAGEVAQTMLQNERRE